MAENQPDMKVGLSLPHALCPMRSAPFIMKLYMAYIIARGYRLEAPGEFHDLTWSQLLEILGDNPGGCGPGRAGDHLVPDTIWGLNVKPACLCHDLAYALGRDLSDKENADWCFLNNMDLMIELNTRFPPLKWLRRRRAWVYYKAVCVGGSL